MDQKKSLFNEKGKMKEKSYELELCPLDDCSELSCVDQVQAICFLNPNEIVFYKNKEGWLGNPGGTIENNESVEETLKRELIEEAQLELVDWKTIGFEEVFYPNKLKPKNKSCFLRVVAKVELINSPITDPGGKACGRVVVKTEEASEKLDWGRKGEILIDLAKRKYSELGN